MVATERWWVGDFMTGNVIADVQPASGSTITHDLGGIPEITLKLKWDTDGVRGIRLDNIVNPWTTYIACAVYGDPYTSDYIVAGPVVSDQWDGDGGIWTLNGYGAEQYLGEIEVMPPAVANHNWQLYDPDLKQEEPWAITALQGVSWRGLINWLIAEQVGWPNSPNCFVFEYTDGQFDPGNIVYTCEATEHRKVLDELNDIADLDGAPEWELRPTWQGGGRTGNLKWKVTTADKIMDPKIMTLHEDVVTGLSITRDGKDMVSVAGYQGGRTTDEMLDATATVAGAPIFLQTTVQDTSSQDQTLLQSAANLYLRQNAKPIMTISFNVPVEMTSYVRPGNQVRLAAESIPHMDDTLIGVPLTRVIGIKHDAGSEVSGVTCYPIPEGTS